VDRFMERHRVPIVVVTLLIAVLGLPLLYFLRFDFNVLNMRSPTAESVATYLELKRDANAGINSIYILSPSLSEADKMASRVAKLPEISRAITLSDFVPDGQEQKLGLIRRAAVALGPAINPQRLRPAPSNAENVRALTTTADALRQAANEEPGPGAATARRLSRLLSHLAKAEPALRARAEVAFIPSLKTALEDLRSGLKAQPVKLDRLPADLKRDWLTPDGRALVDVSPTGDPNDNEVLRKFATAVLAVEPTATGSPVSLQESGRTVVRAFIEAGLWALVSITLLLWIVLKRFGDVLLTLVPLLVAGCHNAGNLRSHRPSAQLCQYHRLAAAARRRRRLQDLLRHGVEGGPNQPAAIQPDPRRLLQRHDHGDCVRQPVDVEPPRHVEHGQAAGAVVGVHARCGGAVPARPYGATSRQEVTEGEDGVAGGRLADPGTLGAGSHLARVQFWPPHKKPMRQPSMRRTLALASAMLPE
jgi:hypothetical protein